MAGVMVRMRPFMGQLGSTPSIPMPGSHNAGDLLDMSIAEIKNRATITGAVEIGRNPGVIHVAFLVPMSKFEQAGLAKFAREQYGL